MTLQQLRTVCAIVTNAYSVSRAAIALHATQSAVSKLLGTLERELGTEIFVRSKGRIIGLTEFGSSVHAVAKRMVEDAARIADMADDMRRDECGQLRIGATPLHARHAVLKAVTRFAPGHPGVQIEIRQEDPQGVVDLVALGEMHFGVTTLPRALPEEIVTLPAYRVGRCVITPPGHPLLKAKRITLAEIAKYPMVAYDRSFLFGGAVLKEFEKRGLQPKTVFKATSADVVKAAVAAGLGIAVFHNLAVDPEQDTNLGIIDTQNLFPDAQACIVLRRGQFLRRFAYDFISCLAPRLTRDVVDEAIAIGS